MVSVPLSSCSDNPYQDRLSYDEVYIRELAESIDKNGLLQPVVGRIVNDKGLPAHPTSALRGKIWDHSTKSRLQLAVGHNRLRALRLLQEREPRKWSAIDVVVRILSDEQMAIDVWAENQRRKAYSPIEEARGIARRMESLGWNQAEAGEKLGMHRSAVANKLRLLKLPEAAQDALQTGHISERQAMALVPAYEAWDALDDEAQEKLRRAGWARPVPEDLLKHALGGMPSDEIRERVHDLVDWINLTTAGEKASGDGGPTPGHDRNAAPEPKPSRREQPQVIRQEPPEVTSSEAASDPLAGWPTPRLDPVYSELEKMTKAQLEETHQKFRHHLWYTYRSEWRISDLKSYQLAHVTDQVQFHANLEACMMLSNAQADQLLEWMEPRRRWQARAREISYLMQNAIGRILDGIGDTENLGIMSDEALRRYRQIETRRAGAFCYHIFLEWVRNQAGGETGDSSESDPDEATEAISDKLKNRPQTDATPEASKGAGEVEIEGDAADQPYETEAVAEV